MKATTIIIIIVSVLVVLFIITQGFVSKASKDIETLPYKVLQTYSDFEIRAYSEANFSSVAMTKRSYKEMSGSGFRVLAGYIFGGNEENKSIAMTSPVAMELGDTMTMKFMIPAEYNLDELPKPNNGQIKFSTESEKIVAAIRYGGWTSDEKLEEKKQELIELLAAEGIEHTSEFTYLGYNPPYEVVNRRNEVTVELVNYSASVD
ncbi:heme-binding protein [Salibacteraceae bacterium]|nr:heme-binding protein [Salibacteraceae bacterium]